MFLSSSFAGPWFIGEVIDGHSGACFAFGVFVDGHFLEGSLTYVVGLLQVRRSLGRYYFANDIEFIEFIHRIHIQYI